MHEVQDKVIALAVLRLGTLRVQRKAIEAAEKDLKELVREYMSERRLKRLKTFEGARAHLDHNTRTYLDKELLCTVLKVKDLEAFTGTKRVKDKLTCFPPKGSKRF